MRQLVKLANIRHRVITTLPNKREDAPHNNRGVVVILRNNLAQLLEAVVAKGLRWIVANIGQREWRTHKGHINPHQHALLIATLIEVAIVRAGNRANGICAKVADNGEVGVYIRVACNEPTTKAVVSHIYASNSYRLIVDVQAVIIADCNLTKSCLKFHPIANLAIDHQLRNHTIHLRVIGTPQLRKGEVER